VTIQDLGSIGELVGAVATVATLAYLAIQIRANTRMMRSQARHVGQSITGNWALSVAENGPLADVFARGLAGPESLTPAERIQFTLLFSQILLASEAAFHDVREGIGSNAQLERALGSISPLLRSPGGRAYWREFSSRGGYPDAFRSLLDAELSKGGPEPAA
jgi:hypothetical protein